MTKLHCTDLRIYMECRRAFQLGILERLKPDDYEKPGYFDFGTAGHAVLQAHYSKEKDPLEVVQSIENLEHRSAIKVLYDLYRLQWEHDDSKLQVASVENSLQINFEGIEIHFTIDLLSLTQKTPKPFYEIIDHKFMKNFPDLRLLDYDFQASFYLWATNKLGIDAKQFTMNVIRKSMPEYPMLLKDGSLSRATTQLNKTEYQMYLWAIENAGLNPDDYSHELSLLKNRGSNTFKRFKVQRGKHELQNFEEDLKYMLDEIHNPNTRFYPHPNLNCTRCQFHFLCKVMNLGGDVETTKKAMYTIKSDDER